MPVLNGWKTYAISALTILYAAAGCALGQLDINTAVEMAFGAAGLGALRHGVTTASSILTEKIVLAVARSLAAASADGTPPAAPKP